jgi:hypothetical protein
MLFVSPLMAVNDTVAMTGNDTVVIKAKERVYTVDVGGVALGKRTISIDSIGANRVVIRHRRNYVRTFSYADFFFGFNRYDARGKNTGFPEIIPGSSTSFAIYLMAGKVLASSGTQRTRFSAITGLGFDWSDYIFDNRTSMQNIDGHIVTTSIADMFPGYRSVKRSKLMMYYLNVPVLLEYRYRSFYISGGFLGGFCTGNHTKIIYNDSNDAKHKYKDYTVNVSPFRYGFTLQAGVDWLKVYANYFVSPLFKNGRGPQVFPFTVGIALSTGDFL